MYRSIVLALVVMGCAVGGCVPMRTAPVDLYRADTRVVRLALKNPRSAICPGQPLDLDVELDAVVDGEMRHLVQRRYDLDDAIFDLRQLHLSSPQGFFGENGAYYPSPDVTVSAQTGFVIYARAPHGPAFSVRFPPAYECTATIGAPGRYGAPALDGDDAIAAERNHEIDEGQDDVSPAAAGHAGQEGGPGGKGPDLTVYVTWVRTPDYTKLLAARSLGDLDRVTLVAPGTTLKVLARGGQGGAGGRGGQGARGLPGDRRDGRYVYGRGGRGEAGGEGGEGGAGGNVEIVVDDRFDDLERMVVADVRGGEGGPGGLPGKGGEGGWAAFREGGSLRGAPGPSGPNGKPGRAGSARLVRASVQDRFEGMGPIVPY
ncbi:MAG: hypothetical protein KF819_36130 [Labilithrix sp.]|nr:hypothetical protein [Labilithrix sp.]